MALIPRASPVAELFGATSLTPANGPDLSSLDLRARDIFRRVVETYLETGEPVGSRTVSKGGLSLSPASIWRSWACSRPPPPPPGGCPRTRACACSSTG